MAKIYQRSFSGGELSPSLHARTDLIKYSTGAKTIRNGVVGRQGGIYNRAGTKFDGEVSDSNSKVRLIPFDLPGGRHFQLEFGDEYMRPLKNWQPIPITAKSIVHISKAAAAEVDMGGYHGFKVGDVVEFSGVVGMTEINGLSGSVTAVTFGGTVFNVAINSSAFTSYVSGGTAALATPRNVEFDSPYTEDEIFQMTFQQQTDEMIIAHESHLPQKLKFLSEQYWTFTEASTSPSVGQPQNVINNGADVVGSGPYATYWWAVTAIKKDTFEESLPAYTSAVDVTPIGYNNAYYIVVSWDAQDDAIQYNIYRGNQAGYVGFVGTSYTNLFEDKILDAPDLQSFPPLARAMFTDGPPARHPNAVGFYQQRQFYGNLGPPYFPDGLPLILDPHPYADRILGSRIGSPTFFNIDVPTQDDSSLSFRLLNKTPQTIRHFLDIGKLLVLTEQGEWVLKGATSGALTPSEINPELISSNGSGYVPPIAVENFAIYIQKGTSSIVRTLGFEFQVEGYRGDDLTINANHLVDQNQIVSWDYQNSPHPIVWSARDDGILLGLTLLPSQAVIAWHRHDFTNGLVECVLRSGDEVGFVIKREINGSTVRYIEHFASRYVDDVKDYIFMDSAVTYNGRNTDTDRVIQITGGTAWDENESLTITASHSVFTTDDVGQALHVTGSDGTFVRFSIDARSDGFTITATPNKTVPASMRSTSISDWAQARNYIEGLDHLEGEDVSIFADGFVIASPNNPAYVIKTVASGEVADLDGFYSVIHAGLPFITDVETLSIDTPNGEMVDKKKLVNKVTLWLEKTRGLFVGTAAPDDVDDPTKDLRQPTFNELKYRESEGYDEPGRLISRQIDIALSGSFNNNGRVIVRQVDPLPMGLLAIAPDGFIPGGR